MEFIREDCIYARQSVDRKDSISIESQIDFCKYELKGGSCRVFKDKGYSGKNTDRPEFQKLLGEIRKGKVRRVIVYKLDRISRSILDFANMMELFQEYDVEFVSSTEKFDTSTPMGRAMLNICIVFAQLERETIQKRVTDAYYSRCLKGFHMSGQAPYGYQLEPTVVEGIRTKKMVADPVAADHVRLMFEMYAEPETSFGDITRYFEEQGIKIYEKSMVRSFLSQLLRKYLPANKDGYTICGCGKILVDAEKTCPACGVNLEKLFALHDVDKLQAGLEQYQKEQAEREEQARQAAIDTELRLHQKQVKRKNNIRKGAIVGGIVLLIIVICLSVDSYQNYSRRQEEQQQLNDKLEQIEDSCIENGNTCTYSVDENIIRIVISDLGMDLSEIPEDLTQTDFAFWTDFEPTTDSWDSFTNQCEILQNQIMTLLAQDGVGAGYSVNTVINSDDGQKMFEFNNDVLVFNYWDKLTSYYSQNIKIWMDALKNLN